MASFEFKVVLDEMEAVEGAINFLKDNSLYIGVPEDTSKRDNEEGFSSDVTNAELLFIHTNGSPINNVPARPVVEPAIADSAEKLSEDLKESGSFAFSGNEEQAMVKLKTTGMRAQNIVRSWFTNPKNGWAPNSPSVASIKRAKGSNNPKPLIDTGELRKSITYFVETKAGREK